jgi:histone H3/H4
MKAKIFSTACIKRLLKREGAKAVSKEALDKMAKIIESYAKLVSKKAIRKAFYLGRKTIKESDFE